MDTNALIAAPQEAPQSDPMLDIRASRLSAENTLTSSRQVENVPSRRDGLRKTVRLSDLVQ